MTGQCKTTGPIQLPLDDDKRFRNVFLGQTIALSLNVRYDENLGSLNLSSTICVEGGGSISISSTVLAALSNLGLDPDVDGLLELANCALAGDPTGGASYSQINQAVDAINRGFDNCKETVSCAPTVTTFGDGGMNLAGGNANVQEAPEQPRVPTSYGLGQNYPNPFNPSTRVTLAVPTATSWSLTIYNVKGQLVKRFSGATGGAAFIDVEWDGLDNNGQRVSTGVYLYRMEAGSFSSVKKMVMLK